MILRRRRDYICEKLNEFNSKVINMVVSFRFVLRRFVHQEIIFVSFINGLAVCIFLRSLPATDYYFINRWAITDSEQRWKLYTTRADLNLKLRLLQNFNRCGIHANNIIQEIPASGPWYMLLANPSRKFDDSPKTEFRKLLNNYNNSIRGSP